MTLDQRIEKDLETLYNNGQPQDLIKRFNQCKIQEADNLSNALFGKPGELSSHGLPGYFTGKREAETVMVMLNPGHDVAGKDKPETTIDTLKKIGININSSLDEFIRTYKEGNRDFGEKQTKPDKFDVKQATFLKPWDGSGIKFDRFDPTSDKIKSEDKLNAVKAVLMDKLQLELVPYASREFNNIKSSKLQCLYPFVETLLDEIFSKKRTYVIFAGEIFERLFGNEQKMGEIGASVKFGKKITPRTPFTKKDGSRSTTSFNCRKIIITYKGNEQDALIAHQYAIQFGGKIFYQYGEFCYETYIGSKI